MDKDQSGEIDAKELQTIYERARGEKLPKAQLKKALAVMDSDGSGAISLGEFQAWWCVHIQMRSCVRSSDWLVDHHFAPRCVSLNGAGT